MKKIKLLLIILAYVSCTYCQTNIVPNAGFETKDALALNSKPDGVSQIGALKNWKNFETSDFYSESTFSGSYAIGVAGNGLSTAYDLSAHTGTNYIGFGPCEGVQVKLEQTIESNTWVKFSFWASPRAYRNTTVNAYLLEKRAPPGAIGNADKCLNPNINFEPNGHFVFNLVGSGVHQPGSWYKFESEWQLVSKGIEYKWLAIKGENIEGTLAHQFYVYVDDVSVEIMDFCDHPCVADLGTVDFIASNTVTQNTPFSFIMENALEYNIVIYSGGNEVLRSAEINPNGLDNGTDPNTPFWEVTWNGDDSHNGTTVQTGVYEYQYSLSNCSSSIDFRFDGDATLFTGAGTIPTINVIDGSGTSVTPTPYPQYPFGGRVPEFDYQYCCVPRIEKRNAPIDIVADYEASEEIILADNYKIPSDGILNFSAGNRIILEPGFTSDFGSNVVFRIDGCSPELRIANSNGDNKSIVNFTSQEVYKNEDNDALIINSNDNLRVNIFPNPNNGEFTLALPAEKTATIIVSNMLGAVVIQTRTTENTTQLNLTNFGKGIYLVEVHQGEQVYREKVVYR
ncbi:MAG: T9SS type A sorting domain-containing protein [Flavobacteriales bacterium]|nr:T9SS type A sorting domain-containing protein [Flavobacteriales bacterium]